MTAQELLERLNLLDENERIEAKQANEIGKSLLETVCAFANEPGLGGGWLLLGVTREELALFPAYEVQGLDQPDKIGADLASQTASVFNRKVDTLAASQALKKLRDAGLFTQKGRGSATWYQPTGRLLGDDAALSSNLDGLSSNPGALSSNPAVLSGNPAPLPAKLDSPQRRALLNELPGELAARVGAVGHRRPPEEVRELVVALCRQRAFRAEELAALLARNAETVRQNYLRPLLRAGRVTMTRPEVPNDPDQAYRAGERE